MDQDNFETTRFVHDTLSIRLRRSEPPPIFRDFGPSAAATATPGSRIGAWLFFAVLLHALIWSVVASSAIGNFNLDTLEIVSWASHWALGYPKHPPLATWLLRTILQLPGPRILNVLLVSQAGIAISAFFIWRTVRLFSEPFFGALAVVFFLASPPATFFSIQVNHNSVLLPFVSALMLFSLRYLEQRRMLDAVILGLVSGLALLTKYEAAFINIAFLLICFCVPRYRSSWTDPKSLAAVIICAIVISPHLYWAWLHNWATFRYATETRPLTSAGDLLESGNQLIDGLSVVAVGPILTCLFIIRPTFGTNDLARIKFGALIAILPVVVMIVLSFATWQIIRQGWIVPLVPQFLVGLCIAISGSGTLSTCNARNISLRSIGVSAALLIGLVVFLAVRAASNNPVAAFSFDSSEFAADIVNFWKPNGVGPLNCIAAPNRYFGIGAVLYLNPIPRIVDLDLARFNGESAGLPCRKTGGVIVLPEDSPVSRRADRLNLVSATFKIPAEWKIGDYRWHLRVYFVPADAPRSP